MNLVYLPKIVWGEYIPLVIGNFRRILVHSKWLSNPIFFLPVGGEVANKYIEYHMEKYGFQAPNVTFIHGYIEKLEEAGIKNESYDIVM